MFIGRERELGVLERLYKTGRFQLPVIYGRRRVGKTALIEQFARELPCVFFTAVESDARVNLRNLSRELYAFDHPGGNPEAAPVFPDFYTAFEAVFDLAREKQVVFVVDEFPYLAKADAGVPSYLQALVDRNKESSKLFLVLCGSSMSFMKEQVLDDKSPLYGRRTAQIELKPFDFFESLPFLGGMAAQEAAQTYGMVGGIPLYLLQFDGSMSLQDNVCATFLDPSSILYEEPSNLLKQEVQKASQYNSILSAIAGGASQNNEIATAVGLTSTEITYYLKELQRLGIVERELPAVKSGRRAVYRVSDNLFRFWHRFVMPHRSTIERGITSRAIAAIEAHIAEYMGRVFEEICRQWLWRRFADGALDFEFDSIGGWWGSDPRTRKEAELDIVCVRSNAAVALGECKWRAEAFPKDELEKLMDRAALVNAVADARYYAFSRSAFTAGCSDLARGNNAVHLVSFDDMVNSAI